MAPWHHRNPAEATLMGAPPSGWLHTGDGAPSLLIAGAEKVTHPSGLESAQYGTPMRHGELSGPEQPARQVLFDPRTAHAGDGEFVRYAREL